MNIKEKIAMVLKWLRNDKAREKDSGDVAQATPITAGVFKQHRFTLKKLKDINRKKTIILAVAVVFVAGIGLLITVRTDLTKFFKRGCDQTIIDRHNQAIRSVDNFADNVKAVALEAETQKGYDKDITCVYIVYQHYSYIRDVDRSRQLLETIKLLHQKGSRIDARVIDQKTIEQMEMYVKSLEHNRDIGDKSDGSG